MEEKLFTPKEIASITQATPATVRRWVQSGQLDAVRLGADPAARFRVRSSALERFLAPGAAMTSPDKELT